VKVFFRRAVHGGTKLLGLGLLSAFLAAQAATVARWDFNLLGDANPETGTWVAAAGSATSRTIGGVSEALGSVGGGATTDPETADNTQARMGRFPLRESANKTAGPEFRISTFGCERLRLSWDQYNSASASRYWRVQYTVDGRAWIDHTVITNTAAAAWQLRRRADFSSIAAANDNADFGIRLVSEFESTATGTEDAPAAYSAVREGASYSTAGTLWLDMVVLSGQVIGSPEHPPEISPIASQTVLTGSLLEPISFTISDPDTPLGDLRLTAECSRPQWITNIVFSGDGTNRALVLERDPGEAGEAEITVRVEDELGASAETVFTFRAAHPNRPPRITGLAEIEAARGTLELRAEFGVSDPDKPAVLAVRAEVSDTNLITRADVIRLEEAGRWQLLLEPTSGRVGEAAITVRASDGELESSARFAVKILPTNAIAAWQFDGTPEDADSATGTLESEADVEAAPAQILEAAHTFGTVGGGESTGQGSPDNSMLRLSSFPADGAGNKTAGIEIRASTAGHRAIAFVWDQYNSGSASRYLRVQYSTNGTDFHDHTVLANPTASRWLNRRVVSFEGIPGAENNANFAVRLVTEFESTASGAGKEGYAPVDESAAYSRSGTLWLDAITLAGELMPITNQPPQISAISDVFLPNTIPQYEIPFMAVDAETSPEKLVFSFEVERPDLLSGIEFGGEGANRWLAIKPAPCESGVTAVKIRAADEAGQWAETRFSLMINEIQASVFVRQIPSIAMRRNTFLGPIPLEIDWTSRECPELPEVWAGETDRLLFGDTGIAVDRNGTNWTITLKPLTNATGRTSVSLAASFKGTFQSMLIDVTVLPDEEPPFLRVVQRDGLLKLSWPSAASDWKLESAESLPAGAWQPVMNQLESANEEFTVTLEPSGGRLFFRLRK